MARPRAVKLAKAAGCTKAPYVRREQAERRAERRMAAGSVQLWVYECPKCGFFHLTSATQHENARRARIMLNRALAERDGNATWQGEP